MIDSYLRELSAFIDALTGLRQELLLRECPAEFGWELVKRIRSRFPTVRFDDPNNRYVETLFDSRVCVFGHLATTYIEALAADRPTVLFIDREIYCHREEARPYFDEMERVGILHYSAPAAARQVTAVYDDVESWWRDEAVQGAKDAFLSRYGRVADDLVGAWSAAAEEFV